MPAGSAWTKADEQEALALWRDVEQQEPAPEIVDAARALLRSEPGLRVCLLVMRRFPAYLGTPAQNVLMEVLVERASQIDASELAQLAALFVELWRKKPRNQYWYGDLRQSFVPRDLEVRLADVPAVRDQLIEDFQTLAPNERVSATTLGCRRLERAAELLLHAPPASVKDVLLPLVELDRIDRQHTRPIPFAYESVYWGMVRVLRKLGVDV